MIGFGQLLALSVQCTGQTKITKFNVAVRIYENVSRLQISVNDITLMKILRCAEHVVGEDLDVLLGQADLIFLFD